MQKLQYFVKFVLRSMFIKLFLLIFMVLSLILTVMMLVVYQYSQENWQRNAEEVHLQVAQKSRDIGDSIFFGIIRLATQISLQQDTLEYVLFENSLSENKKLEESIMQDLQTSSIVYDYIDTISVYSNVRSEVVTNRSINEIDFKNTYDWESVIQKADIVTDGGLYLISRVGRTPSETYPYLISVVKLIEFDKNSLGYVVIDLDVRKLNNIFNVSMGEIEPDVYITSSSGQIFLQKNMKKEVSFLQQSVPWAESLYNEENKDLIQKSEKMNGKWIVTSVMSKNTPFNYVISTPIEAYLQELDDIISFTITMYFASLAFSLFMAVVLTRRIYAPVKNIVDIVYENDDDSEVRHKHGELEYILHSFEKTSEDKKNMQSKLEQSVKQLDRAQAVALQAQINPHFLHNTLETIRFKTIQMSGLENPAAEMISSLSAIFQVSMETEGYFTTVKQEVEYCKKYIQIMQQRYQDKFEVVWEISPQVYDYAMIKLSLQPLIENAIYHGIKPMHGMGCITIKVQEEEKNLIVCVEDNGVGMSDTRRAELNGILKSGQKHYDKNIGMRNVAARVSLVYGEEYGVEIIKIQVGTAVQMRIPKTEKPI